MAITEIKPGQQVKIGDTYYKVNVHKFDVGTGTIRESATLQRIGYTTEGIINRLFK